MTRIGFTGTQHGVSSAQRAMLRDLLAGYAEIGELHHGDCIEADAAAHDIAKSLGYRVVVHPPSDPRKRAFKSGDEMREPLPYLTRNHNIVNGTTFLIATPREHFEQLRSGTWATIRYARKLGRVVHIIRPDGRVM